jgi:hypothetical protein
MDCYIDGMIQGIRDVYSWINSTIFLRRIKDVKTFNPTHALGFNNYDVNIDTILDLWGRTLSTLPPPPTRCWPRSWPPWWMTP